MPEVPAVPGTADLARASAVVFADNSVLASVLPEFEPRPGQREMAEAVAGTFESGGVLLAQAGTGTGKTLAYLVPAILSRRRVLISTGTKNLQEQIFFKDLPVLRSALDIPFTATCMKGRGNYLCLHRFEVLRNTAAMRATGDRTCIALIEDWAPHTETGDRAEIEDLPEDLPFWSEVAATSENCIGTECVRYQDCFVTRMRQRAAESDLVIVNHHLLCADAAVRQNAYGQVVPACYYAIIDEAHQLEDVATQYFGIAVSSYRLDDLERDGERLLEAKMIADGTGGLKRALERIGARAGTFFAALQAIASGSGRPRGGSSETGDERMRVTAGVLQPVAEQGLLLAAALEELESAVALLKQPAEDVLALGRRAAAIREELRFLLRADDAGFVYYLECRRRGIFLRASPIDVAAIVRELLLDRMQATVLTSATLAVSGTFEYIRGRLGIQRALELQLPSEFDHASQALLYLPPGMPDPRSHAFVEAAGRQIVDILRRTQGRAFVLFTSYANLRGVQQVIVETALDYPVLVQGTAPRSVLLRQFRSTPHAVLLATSSFWQGVDVIGDALSCVIIDKLPFASPADPITAARIESISCRGGEPFSDYQVPLAILTLQQGLGRLIRHRQDRGVLAILDPRIRTKPYGRRFLDALPPAPITSDLERIDRFFAA